MHPRISIDGLSSVRWPLDRDLVLARDLGVRAVTVPFIKVGKDVPAAAVAIGASGLTPIMLAGGGASGLIGGLESAVPAIDAAHALGIPSFYSVSGAAPGGCSTDQAFDALVQALAPVTAYGASKGVRVAIEHSSTATRGHGFIHSFADAADLAREADLDIVMELQNIWYERRLPQLFRDNMDRIALVQVSDFKVGEELRLNRRVPGDGDIPLEWLIGQLLDAGYPGYFDIEVLGPHIEQEGYDPAIRRSAAWLSECLTRLGA